MKCDETREFFAEALYGELDDRRMAEFNAHLVSCASCAREYEGLKQTLSIMNGRVRAEPTDAEWREFSRKLDEKLSTEPGFIAGQTGTPEDLLHIRPTNGLPGHASASRDDARSDRPAIIRWLPSFRPAWGYGIAAMLLVAFGVYMGRTFFTGAPAPDYPAAASETPAGEIATRDATIPGGETSTAPSTPAPAPAGRRCERTRDGSPARLSAEAAADATNKDALSYLERSRNLLIGLTNLDEKQSATIDLSGHQRVSRDLYNKGNTLAVALNQPSQQQLRQLVQNLQIILLQLSNMGVGGGTPAVELIRQSVDSKSILLKINLEAIRATLGEAQAGGPGDKSKHNL